MRGQGREGVRAISSTQDQRPSRLPPLSAPARVRPKAPQVWTYLKGRAGREEGSEKFLSHLKCGRHGSQAESRSAGNPDCTLGTQREFSRPNHNRVTATPTGSAARSETDCGPVASHWEPVSAGIPEAVASSPTGSEDCSPHPPGAGRQQRADLKAEPAAGAGLSPSRHVSLGHIHSLREARGGQHRLPSPLLSPASPPPPAPRRSPGLAAYLSSPSWVGWGVRHAPPSPGLGESPSAADHPPPSYSIPSRL